jgi:hypothetical protein
MKPQTYKLAEGAYIARRDDEVQALKVELQRAQAELAAKGGVGNPGVMVASKLGGEHVRQQCRTAVEELIRACKSTSNHPSRADLDDAFARLTAQTLTGPEQALKGFLLPHVQGRAADVAGILGAAATQGRALAVADLAYFHAEQNRDYRDRWWKVAGWLGAAFAGAFLAKLPDLAQWLVHH